MNKRLLIQVALKVTIPPEGNGVHLDRASRGLLEIISADVYKEFPSFETDPIFPPVTVTVLDMNDMNYTDYLALLNQHEWNLIQKGGLRKMKLPLTIATALSLLFYAIVTTIAPDFPISAEQLLDLTILLLGALGVVVTEEQLRAFLVKRGFISFKKNTPNKE